LHGTIESLRTRFPFRSKNTMVSGTRVFFIQKAPVVSRWKTKSIPSAGALRRFMRPRDRASPVIASSGRNATPSSFRRAVGCARSAADASPATRATPMTTTGSTRRERAPTTIR
jgi:hypothetical protein